MVIIIPYLRQEAYVWMGSDILHCIAQEINTETLEWLKSYGN